MILDMAGPYPLILDRGTYNRGLDRPNDGYRPESPSSRCGEVAQWKRAGPPVDFGLRGGKRTGCDPHPAGVQGQTSPEVVGSKPTFAKLSFFCWKEEKEVGSFF